MKKLLLGLLMTLILSTGFGQEFQVPDRTLEQKHNRAVFLAHALNIVGISAGKKSGMTVSEYADYCGDQFKVTWNKEAGFSGLVKGTLNNLETLRRNQNPPIKIVEQTENKVVFDWKINFKGMFDNGPNNGVTYEEYLLWQNNVGIKIAEYLGATYKQEVLDDDWLRITLVNGK